MTLLDAAEEAAGWLEEYGQTESEALLSSNLRAAIAREEERQEIIEGLVEAARVLAFEAHALRAHALCTTTAPAGHVHYVNDAVHSTSAALARYDAMKEDDRA